MTMIQAKVNTRLLAKASRLFTGTLSGRIIEVLQNARRAGARHVAISNRDGMVTVRDDGRGIKDFAKLLDLGGSGWRASLEASEDPAGVGLFCLSPRQLIIRSGGKMLTIEGESWTGAAVEVKTDPCRLSRCKPGIAAGQGTELCFQDEAWEMGVVSPQTVFSGLEVTVDGQPCPKENLIHGQAAKYPHLGCRIKVASRSEMTAWRHCSAQSREYGRNVLVNFYGQMISFSYRPVANHDLSYLVDMTGQPTGIRLMLPARTCLVENDALHQLQAALELESFKHLQGRGRHQLPYQQYLRAQELGIKLPEAEPVYRVGLLPADMLPDPIEVEMPQQHPLSLCYRLGDIEDRQDSDQANVHLLAALGSFLQPFVPVEIRAEFDGYSWAKLPTIGRVELSVGNTLQEADIGAGQLICVDSLSIAAHTSDGRVFRSPVCMAVKPPDANEQKSWIYDGQVYVTPEARQRLSDGQIWYHLGGFNDSGDTYDTQEDDFQNQMQAFWMKLSGPEESLRCKLLDCLADLGPGWQSVTIQPEGRVFILQADGQQRTILPARP